MTHRVTRTKAPHCVTIQNNDISKLSSNTEIALNGYTQVRKGYSEMTILFILRCYAKKKKKKNRVTRIPG